MSPLAATVVSGLTDLRRKKPTQQQFQPERGVRVCERNRSAGIQVGAEKQEMFQVPAFETEILAFSKAAGEVHNFKPSFV